jgi:hypothetical protein
MIPPLFAGLKGPRYTLSRTGDRRLRAALQQSEAAGLRDGRRPGRHVELRERIGDVSDATPEVLQLQRRVDVGTIDWRRLDGSLDAASVQRRAEEGLAE